MFGTKGDLECETFGAKTRVILSHNDRLKNGSPTHNVYIVIPETCKFINTFFRKGFPGGASGREPACQCRRHKRCRFDTWVRKISWRREWQPTPVFLPAKSHGQRSLAGYSLWGCKELDTTELLSTVAILFRKGIFASVFEQRQNRGIFRLLCGQ